MDPTEISTLEYRTAMLLMTAEILAQLQLVNVSNADETTVISATASAAGTSDVLRRHCPNFQKLMNEQAVPVMETLGDLLRR